MSEPLFAMQIFCRIIDTGSMANAARSMGLAPATVTGTLARMEKRLGVRLLDRTTRSINLTEAGHIWYEHAKQMLEQTAEAENAVRILADEPRGALRVTLPLGVAHTFIYPHLHEFSQRFPGIDLDLQVNDRLLDPIENRYDMALRATKPKDSDLTCRLLLAYRRIVCANPRYLETYGTPQHPEELAAHNCLLYRHDPKPTEWEFRADAVPLKIRVKGRYASNESDALLTWARHGLGITMQPEWLVAQDLRDGKLLRLLDAYTIKSASELPGIYALLPNARPHAKKVDVFVQFFADKMRAAAPLPTGNPTPPSPGT